MHANINSTTSSESLQRQIETRPAHGVWAAALSPQDKDLQLDSQRYIDHTRWLLDSCHGVAVFGTTGEANSFSVQERVDLLEKLLAAGISAQRLMVGTGCCAITDSVSLTKHALGLGCNKLLMLPPFYYKGVSTEGLYRNYSEVIQRVASPELRIFLYHFPALTMAPITLELIEKLLREYPGTIAGLKDSSGDWSNTKLMIEQFPELAVFPGSETFLLQGLQLGGAGCISASANVSAAEIREVYDSWKNETDQQESQQHRVSNIRTAIAKLPLIAACKGYIARQQKDDAWLNLRPPLQNSSAGELDQLSADLDKLDFQLEKH